MSKSKLLTKKEALELLAAHLRKPTLPSNVVVKLLLTYGRVAGWGLRPRQRDTDPKESEQDDLNKKVAALEKKRKAEAQAKQPPPSQV